MTDTPTPGTPSTEHPAASEQVAALREARRRVEAIPEAITDGHLNAYGWELWRSALRSEAVTLWFAASPAPSPARDPLDAWADLIAEVRAFEAWYSIRLSVNAWVGVNGDGSYYGGWSVEGDHLYDEWDESEMTTAEGETPAAVIANLISIARRYRERRDAERADDEAVRDTLARLADNQETSDGR